MHSLLSVVLNDAQEALFQGMTEAFKGLLSVEFKSKVTRDQ